MTILRDTNDIVAEACPSDWVKRLADDPPLLDEIELATMGHITDPPALIERYRRREERRLVEARGKR